MNYKTVSALGDSGGAIINYEYKAQITSDCITCVHNLYSVFLFPIC